MASQTRLETYRNRLTNAVLPEEVPPAATGVTLVTAALWAVVLGGWLPLPPMPGPMTAPGVPEAMGTGNGLAGVVGYLLVWGAMMSAMMYPAMLPLFRDYSRALDDGSGRHGAVAVGALMTAYSSVWTATGAVPLAIDALVGVRSLAASHGPVLLGLAGLFVAGYQQTPFKRSSLRDCCETVSLEDGTLSVEGALRRGLTHGRQCVAATWPLFALMVLAGSMNPVVMFALTLVVAAERLPPWDEEVTTAVGVLAGVGGMTVLLVPGLVP